MILIVSCIILIIKILPASQLPFGAKLSNLVGKMVIPAGFEPTACRLGGDRSILLSYGTMEGKTRGGLYHGQRGFSMGMQTVLRLRLYKGCSERLAMNAPEQAVLHLRSEERC